MAGLQTSANPPAADAGQGERILEMFQGVQASSWGAYVLYDLLFTDRRVVGV